MVKQRVKAVASTAVEAMAATNVVKPILMLLMPFTFGPANQNDCYDLKPPPPTKYNMLYLLSSWERGYIILGNTE